MSLNNINKILAKQPLVYTSNHTPETNIIITPLTLCDNILQNKYYNIGNSEKYLVQTRFQAKSSGMNLPEVHGVSKGLDINIPPEKQVTKPLVNKISQIKPRIGQERAGLR